MRPSKFFASAALFFMAAQFLFASDRFSVSSKPLKAPSLSAKSAIVVDVTTGKVLYAKNAYAKLPPASTAKIMTALVALEKLPLDRMVTVSARATQVSPSKAGLTPLAQYKVGDLLIAALVSSSNDAAVVLAEAVAGSEEAFAALMNGKAKKLGMFDTHFVNATGLNEKKNEQFTTAYDLTKLMRAAAKDKRLDEILGITTTFIRGSDGKLIFIRNHNNMLWRTPRFVKGKTGWTWSSQHTFVGTNYEADKTIAFALLKSKKPWTDIERLAYFGILLKNRIFSVEG